MAFPLHQSQLKQNFYPSLGGLSRLAGQQVNLHRSIHTSLFLQNRSIYEDTEDFTPSRSNRTGLTRQYHENEERHTDINSSSYYDEDEGSSGFRRSNRGRFENRRGGNHSYDDFDGRGRSFDNFEGRGRRQDFNYDNFDATDGPDGPVDASTLPEVKKDFFKPTEQLISRTPEENSSFLRDHKITVTGETIPPPIQEFADFDFPREFLNKLQQFASPTAIQAQGWSVAFNGQDFIGVGQVSNICVKPFKNYNWMLDLTFQYM